MSGSDPVERVLAALNAHDVDAFVQEESVGLIVGERLLR